MSLILNGSQYLTIADAAALTLTKPFTLAWWQKCTNNTAYRGIFSFKSAGHDDINAYLRRNTGTPEGVQNDVCFALEDTAGTVFRTSGVYGYAETYGITSPGVEATWGEWRHLAITMSAVGKMSWWVDGTKCMSWTNAAIGACDGGTFYIGQYNPYWSWLGRMAEWAKWDSILSDDNIWELASGIAPSSVGSPAWYLPLLDSKTESIVPLDTTLVGTPSFDDTDHPLTPEGEATLTAWSVQAMSDTQILPTTPAGSGVTLASRLCPGMYGSLSFCLRSTARTTVTVSVANGALPTPQLDIRYVKCWWQNRTTVYGDKDGGLVPELLVKNLSLVLVNAGEETNTPAEPFEDAETLQAISLRGNTTQQYWITVYVPPTAVAGEYPITVTVAKAGVTDITFDVTVTVLPFALSADPMMHGIYYKGTLLEGSTNLKTEAQYTADMENMARHGLLYPKVSQDCLIAFGPVGTTYGPATEEDRAEGLARITTLLNIRAAAGISNDPLVIERIGVPQIGDPLVPGYLSLQSVIDRITDASTWLHDNFGINTVYCHGPDESEAAEMAVFRPYYEAIQSAGGHTIAALSMGSAAALTNLGATIDLPTFNGTDDDPYAGIDTAAWHALGKKVHHYGATVYEKPVQFYRSKYGLAAFLAGFDGVCPYVYYQVFGTPPLLFNDLANNYKVHCLTIPTDNGVVDCIQNEGFREAVNDVRFAQTLINLGGTCPDPTGLDLDDVRETIIDNIIALNKPCLLLRTA